MNIDPITLEIMSNGFKSIADETYIALMKSAYSTNIKERHDHSTAIIDPAGRLIVQAENSLAIHLGSMMGLMNTLLAKMPLSDVREGDIFISNDPYAAGGSHLPDVNMAMPVFAGGKLVCFMCNIAHHADIGGITPGSMAGGTEIYQEGTRIPVIRLFREGELQTDILDLLLLNARVPEGRAARCGDDRGTRRTDADRGIRRDHPPHTRTIAGRADTHRARRICLRGRHGRRRRRHDQHSDPAARHRAAARQQQEGSVRLHRHRTAGEGQHQLDRHGHARGRALFAESAA
jgi:N-methylhydantoinase B